MVKLFIPLPKLMRCISFLGVIFLFAAGRIYLLMKIFRNVCFFAAAGVSADVP
jgi:hypothetical protein